MEKRGQGALEYLLLIGGAVLIAVIVIAVMTGMTNTSATNIKAGAQCAALVGCDQCAKNSLTCKYLKSDGTAVAWGVGVVTCDAASAAAYTGCIAK